MGLHVLITGGAGFIGSHLADRLLAHNHSVTVIDDLSTGRYENLGHLEGHARFCFANETVLNAAVLDRLGSECDIIIHLAAAVGVKLIVSRLVRTIETNIGGTEAALRVAHRYRSKVLIASTSEIYGKNSRVPFTEDDDRVMGSTTKSRWAYAESKAIDEFLAFAYHRERGLPVVVFRLFNTVGPRQTGEYGMVVPRFAEAALRGQPEGWYLSFMERLLAGSEPVLTLLADDPFDGDPPRYARSTLYLYTFGTPDERRAGTWWRRTKVGPFGPTLTLNADGVLRALGPLGR